jgi:SHS2 domain-containing protein
MGMPYEYRDHTGEAWLVATGRTLEEAFSEGAKALFDLMVDISEVEPKEGVEIAVSAEDIERLFFEWLNALIIEKDSQGLVFSRFEIEGIAEAEGGYGLRARVWGEPFDSERHTSKVDVKAATYAGLICERTAEGYRLECVVDI